MRNLIEMCRSKVWSGASWVPGLTAVLGGASLRADATATTRGGGMPFTQVDRVKWMDTPVS